MVDGPRCDGRAVPEVEAWHVAARRGDFARAWLMSDEVVRQHAFQPHLSGARPRHMRSVWKGEPLAGQRVLVRCYHGLGDTIQFIRYTPALRAIAREVMVSAPQPILPLLATAAGIDRLLPLHDGAPDVDCDVEIEAMELAHAFRTSLDTIPRDIPYLHVRPAGPAGWQPTVGLVWRSGEWEPRRSVPFRLLQPLLEIAGINWLSLQLHRPRSETHPRLREASAAQILAAAARIKALDLLITVDSMPAHLAGALGVPVWTVLMKDADWRWLEARDDSPWYPTMRLFRQEEEGDWTAVVRRIAQALEAREPLLPGGGTRIVRAG